MSMSIRNQEIYRERVEEKRTLQAIANKYAISRERVRQIVRKVGKDNELEKSFPETPVRVFDIQWTRRTYNCLRNENLTPMFLSEFVEHTKTNDLRRIPNLGKISLREIKTKLGNHGHVLPYGY
jgi:DNA-directed RNA polymerase alpha subunit